MWKMHEDFIIRSCRVARHGPSRDYQSSKLPLARCAGRLAGSRKSHCRMADTGAVAARGSGGAKDKESVEAALQAQTQAAGWKLMSKPLAQNANDLIAICFKQAGEKAWPCIDPTAKSLGFDRVALVTLDADTAKGVFSISMQIAARGVDVAMIDRTFCDRCKTEQFVRASTDLADVMLQRLSSKGNTTLEVASVPPGAVVQIDGNILGETNNTFRTFAGTHTVMVSREGYKNYVSKVVTAEGKVTEVMVTLVAGPAGSTALTTDVIIKPGDKAAAPISTTKPSKPSATSGVSPPDLISKSGTVSTTNGETGGRSKLVPGLLIGAGVVGLAAGSPGLTPTAASSALSEKSNVSAIGLPLRTSPWSKQMMAL
jgi:hypothetical protein